MDAMDRHFDFETVGAKIYMCTIAIKQTLTGRRIRQTGAYGHIDL
jgi:hypothetical protein